VAEISITAGDEALTSIDQLTDRQREILSLVYQRFSSKEIAQKLDISPKTVDHHIDTARKTLRCSTRMQAARTYWESLPRASLPVADPSVSDASGRTAQGERQSDQGGMYQHPQSHWPNPLERTSWPEPSSLGTGTRLALVFVGALGILVMLGGSVGVMSGIYAFLTALLGEPSPG